MNFQLTPEQRQLSELAQTFAGREIRPAATHYDQNPQFPHPIFTKANQVGLIAPNIPEKYGGAGLGAMALCLVSEQLAWGCLGIAAAIGLNGLIADTLLVGGNEAQKEKYLTALASGRIGAYAVTEPAAGSDVAAIQCRASHQGDHYQLTGSKTWISNATEADFFIIFAKTDPAGGHRAITAFIVERGTTGLTVGRPLGKLGQKAAPAAELFLDNVTVSPSARLGREGDGFKIAMQVFDCSRPMVAALALGLTRHCLEESLAYAKNRQTMGRPIIEHQAIGFKIAEIGMRLEAARLLTYQAAWLLDNGQPNTLQAAYAKAYASETAVWAANETVQIFGGMGYSTEYPAEKLLRDARLLTIYEGSSEIQRLIMTRELRNL